MPGKVLITGGLGNLGSWITKEFSNSGYDVYVLGRKESHKIKGCNYKFIEADITNLDSLNIKLDEDFDYCIHTASFNEFFLEEYPAKALQINALGTRNLLETLSKRHLKKFIYFSTFHVYGKFDGIIDENSHLIPKNDYAATHLFAEYYVKQFYETKGINYAIFRLTNSYGCPMFPDTNKWYLIFNDLVKMAYEKQEIILTSNGNITKDFIWMGDVARISEKILAIKENGLFNLSRGDSISLLELASIIKGVYETRYEKVLNILTNQEDRRNYDNLYVDNTELRNVFKNLKFTDNYVSEINNIFNLLEDKK